MVSLSDIARAVGFNVSVVSRALNPSPDSHAVVRKETRELIQATARRMGYVPNRQASFGRKKRSATILCFIPYYGDRLIADLMFGIAQAAAKENFPVNFHHGQNPEDLRSFLHQTNALQHSGLIAFPTQILREEMTQLLNYQKINKNLLLLNVASSVQDKGLDEEAFADILQVGIDDEFGGMLAAKHLIACGCTRFFMTKCLSLPYRLRYEGFRKAVEEAGFKMEGFLETSDDYLAVSRCGQKVGVYADRDRQAFNDLIFFARHHVVPGEGNVLLVGNDDKQQARFSVPTLTTVHQPSMEEGILAVEKLIHIIFGQPEVSETLKPSLHVRQSTGNQGDDYFITPDDAMKGIFKH